MVHKPLIKQLCVGQGAAQVSSLFPETIQMELDVPRSDASSFWTLHTSYMRLVAGVRSLASIGMSPSS